MIVGVDIGGHHVAAAAVAGSPIRLVPGSFHHRTVDAGANADVLITAWADAIDTVVDQAGPAIVRGIGIAIPGPFDYRAGVGWYEVNAKFRALYGIKVGHALAATSRHSLPLRFLNDATAFTVGCVGLGFAPATGRLMGITLGTGLGSALLEDGVPVIAGDGVPPNGCLWDRPFKDSIADDYVSARWLLNSARRRAGRTFDDVAAIAAAARAGDGTAAAVFAEYGANLGQAIAPWLASFGADAIMLGGRITGAADLFSSALTDALTTTGRSPAITIHEDTEDAAIAGGAMTFDPAFWERAQHRLPER